MRARHLALVAGTALTLTACLIGKPMPLATTYVVDPPPPAAGFVGARRPETLRVGNTRVAAPFAGNSLVYRMDDVRYASDPYHVFLAEPGAMLGNQIAAWLDSAGPFTTVAHAGVGSSAAYVLEATVTELYGDFREGHGPAAVMTIRFVLMDQTGTRPKVMRERTIGSRIALDQASPDALVRGYGKALADILSQLVSGFAAENVK